MPYSKQTWANGASGGTPLSAARLDHMEDGIAAAVTSVNAKTGDAVLTATDVGAATRVRGGSEATAAGSATTGTVTLDCSVASVFTVAPTGNVTLSPANVPASGTACTITVVINQGATVRTVALPSGGVWLGTAPTQAASKACVVTMMTVDGGTTWLASGAVQV